MKLLRFFSSTSFFTNVSSLSMPTNKICKDCRYFIGDKLECGKFCDTNLVTGQKTYDSAFSVREDETKCGKVAVYFEENHFQIVTVPYYFFKDNFLLIIPSAMLVVYVCALFSAIFNK